MGDQSPTPEFGPRGYLPERASKRARKIVLRAPLGLQWIVAAVVFGLLVLVAGVVWLNAGGPPGAPFVAAGPVSAGGPSVERVESPDVWLVLGTGPVLAVPGDVAEDLVWCEPSNHLESGDGRVWTATGRGLGTDSLPSHPVTVHDGTAYVDPTEVRPGARPSDEAAEAAC